MKADSACRGGGEEERLERRAHSVLGVGVVEEQVGLAGGEDPLAVLSDINADAENENEDEDDAEAHEELHGVAARGEDGLGANLVGLLADEGTRGEGLKGLSEGGRG